MSAQVNFKVIKEARDDKGAGFEVSSSDIAFINFHNRQFLGPV